MCSWPGSGCMKQLPKAKHATRNKTPQHRKQKLVGVFKVAYEAAALRQVPVGLASGV